MDSQEQPVTISSIGETLSHLKVPPHSLDAEQGVLGGLMLSADLLDDVQAVLHGQDFYHARHRLIFEALQALAADGEPLDVITVSEYLGSKKQLDNAGGLAYLAELAKNTPGVSNAVAYARIVHDRAVLRQLIHTAQEIAESGFNTDGRGSQDLLAQAEEKINRLAEGQVDDSGLVSVTDLLRKTLDRITELNQSDKEITGLTTGFRDLDAWTSGWQAGDMIVLAARPSMGKTTLAMNAVENALLYGDGNPVLVFSLEMPAESLVLRMLSSLGKIDQGRIRTGKLEAHEWDKLSAAMTKLKDKPLWIVDTPGISPAELRASVRRYQKEHGAIGLIMVDYLQLMSSSSGRAGDNRTNEISDISRALKSVAREFKCPVLVLSQLSRAPEQRKGKDKRPINSDLRESGAIEQDADVILFIYRDEVYDQDSPDKGYAEIIIGKQRNGPIGIVELKFDGKYTRFENTDRVKKDAGF